MGLLDFRRLRGVRVVPKEAWALDAEPQHHLCLSVPCKLPQACPHALTQRPPPPRASPHTDA
jgi:hypothetical protein